MFAQVTSVALLGTIPPLPRQLYESTDLRVLVFALRPGMAIAPDTSTSTVLMYVISGEGEMRLGNESRQVGPGDLAVCQPEVPHGFSARSDMVVLAVVTPAP